MTADTFEELRIWQEARRLANSLYAITRQAQPFMSDYGLVNQIRRAAVAISSKIAEGHERGGSQHFFQFLSAARGSSGEVRSQLYLAIDLGYVEAKAGETLIDDFKSLSKMIANFAKYVKNTDTKGVRYKH